jgi:RNA-binding protein NOB1
MESQKPVHTVILDTGAIIRNHPTVSTLLAQSEQIVTIPAIISEIRDAATRTRVETQLMPFLTIRSPSPASVKFVTDFARKTGDLDVLSKADIQIVALAYELECERNGGDWRLRRNPGQKGLNGKPPVKIDEGKAEETEEAKQGEEVKSEEAAPGGVALEESTKDGSVEESPKEASVEETQEEPVQQLSNDLAATSLKEQATTQPTAEAEAEAEASDPDDDSDGDWITPSNLQKHQEKDASGSTEAATTPQSTLQVATLTTDFAMQNVLLQINLNLISPALQRIKHLKTYILRCHACFCTTKEMTKQFCPRCGSPTLTRVACSTTSSGEFKLHLKKNMQWNTRGDRFSIPKPVHGSANGRVAGGGKGHWGNELILAEDQKEFTRHFEQEKRRKERDLMDEDYLPSILTGDRNRASGGRMKVGGGRNVNSRKR